MKNRLTLIAFSFLLLISCKKQDNNYSDLSNRSSDPLLRYSGSDYSQHIHKDSALRMIQSYLSSIDYPANAAGLTCLIFNADSMRSFLSNSNIATLKFSLAHKLSFINSGNYGESAGTNASSLTFILSGLDEEDDNYIYAPGNMVYDLTTSERLTIDSANRMIESYLTSIDYADNNNDLRSLTFDADTMRRFLSNPAVVQLKFAIAHRDTYINAGNYGVYCGTNAAGFTFVIYGLNSSDQIVYTSNNMVMEHTRPCPSFCATSALLTY